MRDGWISVDERLPEAWHSGPVLTWPPGILMWWRGAAPEGDS